MNLCKNKLYQLDGLSDIIKMAPTVKILNLSKNELKVVCELDKMKGLWLEGNPLRSTFPDQSTYTCAIRKCFPKLLCQDGQELPPPIISNIADLEIIEPCKENYKGSETLKNPAFQFLLQYYLTHDYGYRQCLSR